MRKLEAHVGEKRLRSAGIHPRGRAFFTVQPSAFLLVLLLTGLVLPGLVLPGLACRTVTGAFLPAPTQTSQNLSTRVVSLKAPTATPTWTLTPVPTWTALPSTTPTPADTPTPVVTPSEVQLRVFEKLWLTVRDNYLYPDFNGLDWNAVHSEYRQQIEAGLTDEAFYTAMGEMIYRLGDDHSTFLSPDLARQEDVEFTGESNYVGIGVLTRTVPERNRVVILLTFPGGPAEAAGLQSHDSILDADGQPILDENGFRRDLLLGPEGTKVLLTVQSPGQQPRQVEITRARVNSAMPVPFSALTTPKGKRVGYILLPTFADETVIKKVKTALSTLSTEGRLDGVILDNRMNNGGADYVARGVLSYFTRGVLGYFMDRDQHKRSFSVTGIDVNGSSKAPLVVLVGPDTISFGEIFSGALSDMGRAYLIGERTAGNVELLRGFDFEDGSRAWIAHEAFHPRNHLDVSWEKTGVVPDQVVLSNWDQVTLETDPVVKAALDHFDGK